MDRIDKIILESINNFLINEVDEGVSRFVAPYQVEVVGNDGVKRMKWIRTPEEHKLLVNAARQKKQAANPNYVPPKGPGRPAGKIKKISCLAEARTPNQIAQTLRAEWDSQELKNILSFNKNVYGMFGKRNARAFWDFFESTLTPYHTKYREVSKLTSDIEAWGKKGDMAGVEYRIKDMPKPLEELGNALAALFDKCQELQRLAKTNNVPLPGGMKPSVINGYITSHGLNDLIVYSGKNSDIKKIVKRLNKCADYIRSRWGDNLGDGTNDSKKPIDVGRDLPGIKTIRR